MLCCCRFAWDTWVCLYRGDARHALLSIAANFLKVSSIGLKISLTEKGVECLGLKDMVQPASEFAEAATSPWMRALPQDAKCPPCVTAFSECASWRKRRVLDALISALFPSDRGFTTNTGGGATSQTSHWRPSNWRKYSQSKRYAKNAIRTAPLANLYHFELPSGVSFFTSIYLSVRILIRGAHNLNSPPNIGDFSLYELESSV